MTYGSQLAEKGGEFYLCMRHLHARGASDVISECKEIVEKAKAEGVTFVDIEKQFVEISRGSYRFEKDIFAQKVKELFDDKGGV